ncbi:MAG: FliA/WhiG family RNA polymerase sigma factor [Myxococcota bacterium]
MRQANLKQLSPDAYALVVEYYPLARTIAKRTHGRLPKGIDVDDLVSTAVIGLIEAVERFDPSRGVAFKSYAKHRIQGAILDSLRATDWVPRAVRRRAELVESAQKALRDQLGRAPTIVEISAHLGLDLEETHDLVHNTDTRPLLSLDVPVDDESGTPLADLVPDEDCAPDRRYEIRQLRRAAVEAIEDLPERERVAIHLFYFQELSLKEVGTVLGVSESRACQLNTQGIKRLQARLRAQIA